MNVLEPLMSSTFLLVVVWIKDDVDETLKYYCLISDVF